jgi:hypothetical protein
MKVLDVNDLMIGNWVKHEPSEWSYRNNDNVDLGNIYFQWEDRDWVALGECTLSIEALSAIPLTEEILLKCEGSLFIGYSHFKSYYNINGINVNFIDDKWIEYVSRVEIKYLHELQNIYYWRTKKHLQIKL